MIRRSNQKDLISIERGAWRSKGKQVLNNLLEDPREGRFVYFRVQLFIFFIGLIPIQGYFLLLGSSTAMYLRKTNTQ